MIDQYIVDFYCSKAKLIIELDGSQHYTVEGEEYDSVRTEVLEQYGLEVIRFSNDEIDRHFDDSCRYIEEKIKERIGELKCSPFVRQYGIIEIYQLKSLTKGGIFMPKGQPNKRYTPEFKIKVVETMHREKLSYRETARQFDIPNSRVTAWERIYLEEGAEGLYVERRGRKSTGRSPKIKKEVEEDLIAEVQRLRAENAYLKKLNALVAERVRQEKKHK